ncbi:hypothetical protein E1J38_002725 [Seonamhaeicola sediminis]|uniref:Uncharacterized protein n=1 Tax=Seonamhaeicola sediminis TaxID=2528206 RepID=A0A562YFQ3_9FLAO|nr:hypothetical protein [Seonamhaeicola sediminis]TWO33707.1 hypothetical protein E1J38_002725 [Seonamhaeicola sediminis]
MHKTVATLLAFLYLIAMLRPIQPYVEYVLNQDYIAEFLCINKDKPELQCNGKCHLAKEIKKQQEQEPSKALSISMENYPIGFVNILNIKTENNYTLKETQAFFYNNLYNFTFKEVLFQPPIV